jgi:hypothetical protein
MTSSITRTKQNWVFGLGFGLENSNLIQTIPKPKPKLIAKPKIFGFQIFLRFCKVRPGQNKTKV